MCPLCLAPCRSRPSVTVPESTPSAGPRAAVYAPARRAYLPAAPTPAFNIQSRHPCPHAPNTGLKHLGMVETISSTKLARKLNQVRRPPAAGSSPWVVPQGFKPRPAHILSRALLSCLGPRKGRLGQAAKSHGPSQHQRRRQCVVSAPGTGTPGPPPPQPPLIRALSFPPGRSRQERGSAAGNTRALQSGTR